MMKKALFLLLIALLGLSAASAAAARYGVTYRSNVITLRRDASANSEVILECDAGTWVTIQETSGNWHRVTLESGQSGYMNIYYVSLREDVLHTVAYVKVPRSDGYLNLRETPTMTSPVIGIYYNDAPAIVEDYASGWYRVSVNGQTGYFRQEYLVIKSNQAASYESATVVSPNDGPVNLRTAPSMSGIVIRSYKSGSYAMVLQKGTDWWRVSIGGQTGYMRSEYLKSGLLSPSQMSSLQKDDRNGSTENRIPAAVLLDSGTEVLVLRSCPDTSASILDQYTGGTKVQILERGIEWCRVQIVKTGLTGYMMTEYLQTEAALDDPTMTVVHPDETYVNLRSEKNGTILAEVPHGTLVTVLAAEDDWVKVEWNGMTGWILRSFLK